MNDTANRNARAIARILDTAITIPGTSIKVGLDGILGLIPGAGDVASAALGSLIVMAAVRSGAPTPVIARMVGNIALDTAVGTVPILGDLFDIAFKSNKRNADLLDRYTAQPVATTTRSKGVIVAIGVGVVLVLVAIVALGIVAARALWQLLTN